MPGVLQDVQGCGCMTSKTDLKISVCFMGLVLPCASMTDTPACTAHKLMMVFWGASARRPSAHLSSDCLLLARMRASCLAMIIASSRNLSHQNGHELEVHSQIAAWRHSYQSPMRSAFPYVSILFCTSLIHQPARTDCFCGIQDRFVRLILQCSCFQEPESLPPI